MNDHDDKLLLAIRHSLAEVVDAPEIAKYCIALSSGLDSTVLLTAMTRIVCGWPGAALRAIHVNHRLHPDAVRWASLAERLAASLNVPFESVTLESPPAGPQGLEAEARQARYNKLESALAKGEVLLTAHHADDQLETFLLQLLRGAGPAGLAAMPLSRPLGPGQLVRPMLGVTRSVLADWAVVQDLEWIDDPSNADDRHARNYLRRHVLPSLSERWPEAAGNAVRSASLCAEAASLLRELGRQDVASALGGGNTLGVGALRGRSEHRVRNALRTWIADSGHVVPGFATLHEITKQVLHAGKQAAPGFSWAGAELKRYRDALYLMSPLVEPPAGRILWANGTELELPDGLGRLDLRDAGEEPMALAAHYLQAQLTVRFRCGGETFKPAGGRTRPVKKWLQDKGVPPWRRERWPLIYLGDAIAWVPGLGPAARFAAGPGENARIVLWQRPATGASAGW